MAGEQKHTGAASGGMNLDLTNVEDPTEIAAAIEVFYKNDTMVKSQLSWNWERNQLMVDGRQWIVYSGNKETGGTWQPLKVTKDNEYIPRPVTNYMFDIYQTLKGYLLKSKPRITVRPNSQTNKDKDAAKLATLVAEANVERLHEEENDEYAASCLLMYGTVFKKDFWDNSYVSQVEVPQTVQVPVTDPMTGQVTGMAEQEARDENGDVIKQKLPLGDINTDVVEPYRIALDPLASDLHKARWVMEYSIQPLNWIKETYGKQADGYTGRADEVKAETQLNNSLRRFHQLKTSSGIRGGFVQTDAGLGAEAVLENMAVVKEYYERPSLQHPNGRLCVVANNIPLYIGDSLSEGNEQGDWHPYSECRWEIMPGRFWGKAPLDDAAEIQKNLNSIDAIITLTRKTMAIPQKLIPLGIGVEPGKMTGRPGNETFYRADGTGAKPEIVPATGVHESVFQEREMKLNDLKQITGAIDILKGDRPPGVTAASALSMLYEVGTGKLFPVLNRWKRFKESSQKKQLKLVAKNYKEPRPEFIRALKMKNSDLSEEVISNFIGTDLYDNCNVIIEAGSNVPKLQAAEQALLMEVAQTGALALEQPANRLEFLQRLGIVGFDSDVGPDTKRAEWENDLLDNLQYSPDNKPVVLITDNHAIHHEVHANRTKQPSFMSLPIEIQQAYFMHMQEHDMYEQQNQQMQMMQAAVMGQPPAPPAAPQSGNAPQPTKASGNGVSSKMREALFSDALVPGQAKPTK